MIRGDLAETIGDVTGEAPKQEIVAATAAHDLQAYNETDAAAGAAWSTAPPA